MTKYPTDNTPSDSQPDEAASDNMTSDGVDEVLGRMAPRPRADHDTVTRVYANALAEFEALPVSKSTYWPQALAASILGAVALAFVAWQATDQPPAQPGIASVSYASGGFSVSGNRAEPTSGDEEVVRLSAGSRVVTSQAGRMMLSLGTDTTVRIDVGSQVALPGPGEIRLDKGRIYVDSRGDLNELSVLSDGLRVTKVGTQFSVQRRGEELTLAVREGKVRLGGERSPIVLTARSGVAQQVRLLAGVVTDRTELSLNDNDAWAWTQQARPDFATNGASLYEYLRWVARETGRTLVFEAGAEAAARRERELAWGAERVGIDDMELFLRAAAEPLEQVPDPDPSLLRVTLRVDPRPPNH